MNLSSYHVHTNDMLRNSFRLMHSVGLLIATHDFSYHLYKTLWLSAHMFFDLKRVSCRERSSRPWFSISTHSLLHLNSEFNSFSCKAITGQWGLIFTTCFWYLGSFCPLFLYSCLPLSTDDFFWVAEFSFYLLYTCYNFLPSLWLAGGLHKILFSYIYPSVLGW